MAGATLVPLKSFWRRILSCRFRFFRIMKKNAQLMHQQLCALNRGDSSALYFRWPVHPISPWIPINSSTIVHRREAHWFSMSTAQSCAQLKRFETRFPVMPLVRVALKHNLSRSRSSTIDPSNNTFSDHSKKNSYRGTMSKEFNTQSKKLNILFI